MFEYVKIMKKFTSSFKNFIQSRGLDIRRASVRWRKQNNELFQQYWKVARVVMAYWIISALSIYINKEVLGGRLNAETPVFIVWFQCVFTTVVCLALAICIKCASLFGWGWGKGKVTSSSLYPDIHFHLKYIILTLPLSLTYAGMIGLYVLCLKKNVGAALYYLIRSSTTLFTLGFTLIILSPGSKVTGRAFICYYLLTIGWLIGFQPGKYISASVTTPNLCLAVLSTVSIALNAVFTSWTLPKVRDSVWMLVLYNNLNCCGLLVPLAFYFMEIPPLLYMVPFEETSFRLWMLIGGVCSMAMALITALQVKVTSALTHNISETAKFSIENLLNSWLSSNSKSKSIYWWLSNWIILLSCMAYARIQSQPLDMEKAQGDGGGGKHFQMDVGVGLSPAQKSKKTAKTIETSEWRNLEEEEIEKMLLESESGEEEG